MKPYCIVVNELASLNPYLRPAILFFVSELLGSQMEGMEDLSQVINLLANNNNTNSILNQTHAG